MAIMRKPEPSEFTPLPWYSWDARPDTVPLDDDECATAIYLDNGDINKAAMRLRITRAKLNRAIRKSPQLQRLIAALAEPSG
jgi:hypothetical protein